MNPLAIRGLILLAGAVAAFGAGWAVNGWRLGEQIADLKAEHAQTQVSQAQAALLDLSVASKNIRAAADTHATDFRLLSVKLDALKKEWKNEKPAPLPVDCRPDAFRVRHLDAAIDASNEAGTGR